MRVGYLGSTRMPARRGGWSRRREAEHPAIRSVAISSLGQRGSVAPADDDGSTLRHLAALDDPAARVRIAALVSLINLWRQDRWPRRTSSVSAGVGREFARMERACARTTGTSATSGSSGCCGELDRAAGALQIALELEPARATAKFLLALARLGSAALTTPARC